MTLLAKQRLKQQMMRLAMTLLLKKRLKQQMMRLAMTSRPLQSPRRKTLKRRAKKPSKFR